MELKHAALPFVGLGGLAATPAHAETLDLSWVVDLAIPYVETILLVGMAALVGWIASRAGRWLGLEIDRDHAEALHAAIARGVRHAVMLVRTELKDKATIDVESRLIAQTAVYLEQLMPDALHHFGLDDMALDRLIRAHIGPDVLHWAGASTQDIAPSSGLDHST